MNRSVDGFAWELRALVSRRGFRWYLYRQDEGGPILATTGTSYTAVGAERGIYRAIRQYKAAVATALSA